jgi:hypothetical protein
VVIVGVVFLVLAGVAAGALGLGAPLGAAIYFVAPAFLNTLQAGVQRHLAPWLWDSVLLPVLEAPAWVPFAVVGVLLIALRRARWGRRVA